MKKDTISVTPNQVGAINQSLKQISPKFEFKTRMQFAAINQQCETILNRFKSDINLPDISQFQAGMKAINEKYKSKDSGLTMAEYTKEVEILERKHKAVISKFNDANKAAEKNANIKIEVEINKIDSALFESLETDQQVLINLLPIIEQS